MIVATAGHVDHGKTSLIRHLTGVETDRLAEEKKRGLSIELGYAYRALPAAPDQILGFIDVPGHERFINTMISGVSGIDLGMLVIAADDGVMPQTKEHLQVMQLLGLNTFIVVITKIDRVDSERVNIVQQEILTFLEGSNVTALEIFAVSNETGEGIDSLQAWLDSHFLELNKQQETGIFRLSIDRAFSLKGIGSVVTGTILDGHIDIGDSVRLLPGELTFRVRQLHAQDQEVERAGKGLRCALNLSGEVNKAVLRKGDWLTGLDAGDPTNCFTASADLMSSPVNIKHMMRAKLYIGARHVEAKLSLLQNHSAGKNNQQACLLQVLTQEAVFCCKGDHFLLRDYSEKFLLGGGKVLDPSSPRIRKMTQAQEQYLSAMAMNDFAAATSALLLESNNVIDAERYRQAWNFSAQQVTDKLEAAAIADKLIHSKVGNQTYVLSRPYWQFMLNEVVNTVSLWHKNNPDKPGLGLEVLKEKLIEKIDIRLLNALLDELQTNGLENSLDSFSNPPLMKGKLVQINGLVKSSNFNAGMSEKAQQQWQEVEAILLKQGLEIPLLSELEKMSGVRGRELNYLISTGLKSGRLQRISPKRIALSSTLKLLADEVMVMAQIKPYFTVIDFKNHLGLGRNYVIELLDFMDTLGFTSRVGNERIIEDDNIPQQIF
ncbi:MAG: selenocysteine-specific elongation factor [Pseudohongiellaceae bacterium]